MKIEAATRLQSSDIDKHHLNKISSVLKKAGRILTEATWKDTRQSSLGTTKADSSSKALGIFKGAFKSVYHTLEVFQDTSSNDNLSVYVTVHYETADGGTNGTSAGLYYYSKSAGTLTFIRYG